MKNIIAMSNQTFLKTSENVSSLVFAALEKGGGCCPFIKTGRKSKKIDLAACLYGSFKTITAQLIFSVQVSNYRS